MKFLILSLVVLHAFRVGAQEFVCGFRPTLESEDTLKEDQDTKDVADYDDDAYYRSGTINPVVVFGKLKDQNDPVDLSGLLLDREGLATERVESYLDINHEGSLAHYFFEMSNRTLSLDLPPDGININWYQSNMESADKYVGKSCETKDYYGDSDSKYIGMPGFIEEVLKNADNEIDFGERDDNGVAVYDKNGDNVIDVVLLFFPPEFGTVGCPVGNAFVGTRVNYVTNEGYTVKKVLVSRITYAENGPLSFPFMVGVMAHEYGHLMGISHELYDTDLDKVNEINNSAGIGYWGVMGHGGLGWLHGSHFDGPNLMSVWSQAKVGWISPVVLETNMSNVKIYDITSSVRNTYKILISESEYFLVSNRQNTYSETGVGSYYEAYAPASGLAIWHVDENIDHNDNEFHKRVDLECADGLYRDKGYDPDNIPSLPNSVSGTDNLDYLSTPSYSRVYKKRF